MAYITQEMKKEVASQLKKIIPKTWKWSLSISHHSAITLTISSAPFDQLGEHNGKHLEINQYYMDSYVSGVVLPIFDAIKKAMNYKNFDNSCRFTDYHHVGYYINIRLGRWDKPFSAQ